MGENLSFGLVPVLGILSLFVSVIPISAQALSSGSTSSNSTISESHVTQMGICVVGAGGPCDADSNWDGTHDVTGKCVLLNGCRNDNGIGNNNRNPNNIVSGR
jgi:hypothetical protein